MANWIDKFLLEKLDKKFLPQKKEIKNTSQTSDEGNIVSGDDTFITDGKALQTLSYNTTVDYIVQNKNQLIQLWRETSLIPEVDEAIQEIVNDCITVDEERDDVVELLMEDLEISDSLKEKIQDKFDKLLYLLDFNTKVEDYFRQWYVDGSIIFESVYNNNKLADGIQDIKMVSPMNFFKHYNQETGEVNYFSTGDVDYNKRRNMILTAADLEKEKVKEYEQDQITYTTSGIYSIDKLFPLSYLHKSVKPANHLELVEESIIVYRFNTAPDRKAFYIDTGRMPAKKSEAYVQSLMRDHKSNVEYDSTSGRIIGRKKSIPLFQDWWFPVNADGRGTRVDTISGTGADLSDITDLEYFIRKLYKSLEVPLSRREQDKEFRNMTKSNLDIENDELKFWKSNVKKKKRFISFLKDLLEKELISSKLFSYNDWIKIKDKVKIQLTTMNHISEMKRLARMEDLMDVASTADGLREQGYYSKQWIKENILSQTEEEIKEIEKQIEKERESEPEDDGGGRW